MTTTLGIELGASTLRAVLVEGWPRRRTRVLEIPWEPDNPAEAAAMVHQHFGRARHVAVALDLPLLITKRVKLPALAAVERRNILRLEPERFFSVRGEDVVLAVRADDDLVFAAREAPLAEWVGALETLGALELVEPGPLALARALAHAGQHTGTVLLVSERDGTGVVEMRAGQPVSARRVFGDLNDAAAAVRRDGNGSGPTYLAPWTEEAGRAFAALLPTVTLQPLPTVADVAGPFLVAYGAALGVGTRTEFAETLVTPELGARIRSRRRRELGIAALGSVAALVFALSSFDARRERAGRALDQGIQNLDRQAAPSLALEAELAARQARVAAIRRSDSARADPLRVLLALSRHLPVGAHVRALRWSGGEWQIDGYAPNASRLVTQLGGVGAFVNVRFLAATNRVVTGKGAYESFSLAFRFAPAP